MLLEPPHEGLPAKLAAHVVEIVGAAIEIRGVDDRHLGKALGKERGGQGLGEGQPRAFLVVGASQERFVIHRVGEAQAAEKIVVLGGECVGLVRRRSLLDVGLDDRAVGSQVLEEFPLVLYDSVQQAIDGILVLAPQRERGNSEGSYEQKAQGIRHRFIFVSRRELKNDVDRGGGVHRPAVSSGG